MSPTSPPPSSSKEPPRIIICPDADLEIRFYGVDNNDTLNTTPKNLAVMIVSRDVLIQNSPTFKAMLTGRFKESNKPVIEVQDNNVVALELWFRCLHDTLTSSSYEMSVPDIYTVIERSHFYLFHLEKLEDWFAEWFKVNLKNILQMSVDKATNVKLMNELELLVYPCRQFDYAPGFAQVTRRLAYENRGHISLYNYHPKSRHLQLSPRLVGGINGSRASLAYNIHEGLYIHHKFLKKSCKCKEYAMFAYEEALYDTGCWPLMSKTRGRKQWSVRRILDSLDEFEYKAPQNACKFCSQNFKRDVEKVQEKVEDTFDGLCLDCIKNPRRKDKDEGDFCKGDYYDSNFDEPGRRIWDIDCRISHGQPSWYFSWLASDQRNDVHEDERDERKKSARTRPTVR